MSIIRAIKHRLGLSVTPANNFVLDASADNGTMKLARESGQDIMTVDAAGKVAFPQGVAPQSGQILQQLIFDGGSVTNISALTPANIIDTLKSITPKSTNSTLIVESWSSVGGTTPAAGVNLTRSTRLYESTIGGVFGGVASVATVNGAGSGMSPIGVLTNMEQLANASLSPRTFGLSGYVSGTGSANYSSIRLKITEVQN